jgi:hypothetical protein
VNVNNCGELGVSNSSEPDHSHSGSFTGRSLSQAFAQVITHASLLLPPFQEVEEAIEAIIFYSDSVPITFLTLTNSLFLSKVQKTKGDFFEVHTAVM